MHAEEMPESDKREPKEDPGVNYGRNFPNPRIEVSEVGVTVLPRLSERVETVDLSGSMPGVPAPAAGHAPSAKPHPTRVCADLSSSRYDIPLHTNVPNATTIDGDTPLAWEKADWTAGQSGLLAQQAKAPIPEQSTHERS